MGEVTFLFDLDGTLVSLASLQRQAIELAFLQHFGVKACLDTVPSHGATHRGIFHSLGRLHGIESRVIDQEFTGAVLTMADFVEQNWLDYATGAVLPGVTATLDAIARSGNRAGILSGNPAPIGTTILRLCGLEGRFLPHYFGDKHRQRADLVAEAVSENAGARQLVIVGDTPADIEAARTNGLASVAVLTGAYTKITDFDAVQPEMILTGLDAAPNWLWSWPK